MTVFKTVGAALILLSAIILVRSYTAYERERVMVASALLSFLISSREAAVKYMTPIAVSVKNITDELLLSRGFVEEYHRTGSASAAYERVRGRYRGRIFSMLSEEFSGLGSGYLSGELDRLRSTGERIKDQLERERGESEKNIKVTTTLVIAAAFGIIILLL